MSDAADILALTIELSGAATISLTNRLLVIEGRGNCLKVDLDYAGELADIVDTLDECLGVIQYCEVMDVRDSLVAERDVIRAELIKRGVLQPEDAAAA